MEVSLVIDELTNCLIERRTGELVKTEYHLRSIPVRKKDYKDWNFNWSQTEINGYSIYELFVAGDSGVQGRISLKVSGGVVEVDIAESAPHNLGHTGQYQGVWGHLFAIACQVSMEKGCDGVVAFTAKTGLIEHYRRTLNAKVIHGQRMYIDEAAANILLDKYIRR